MRRRFRRTLKKIRDVFRKAMEPIARLFFTKFPTKTSVNILVGGIVIASIPLLIFVVYSFFGSPEDTSRLGTSRVSIRDKFPKGTREVILPKSVLAHAPPEEHHSAAAGGRKHMQINYRAKQVIERTDFSGPALPMGTEFIGRLMTAIDTRDAASFIKIEVPYGGSFQGNELLPKNSILFAVVRYDGNGEKVFLDIQSGTYPNGQQFKIRGQALDAKDFSPGIRGDFHGMLSNRVAGELGLNFVTGLTDTLQEKESLGGGGFAPGSVTAKPTLKNGFLVGVSKVTDSEAQRMSSELSGQKPYITIEEGKELIVSLQERFNQ